ncbi:hypothetical protein [Algibacter sp. L3A6]|uniref:hypothetical protein n=1 Tax=Algibacter sp. L3A6 TaxID=2686366 RepID=UPI00131E46AD|nr:hypothetical protein [Algibacter sp. L3A6]
MLDYEEINPFLFSYVNLDVPGKVIIKVKNETVELRYDKKKLKATIETIELEEKKLSKVWGDAIYRLSLNAKMLETEGNYKYSIRKVK